MAAQLGACSSISSSCGVIVRDPPDTGGTHNHLGHVSHSSPASCYKSSIGNEKRTCILGEEFEAPHFGGNSHRPAGTSTDWIKTHSRMLGKAVLSVGVDHEHTFGLPWTRPTYPLRMSTGMWKKTRELYRWRGRVQVSHPTGRMPPDNSHRSSDGRTLIAMVMEKYLLILKRNPRLHSYR